MERGVILGILVLGIFFLSSCVLSEPRIVCGNGICESPESEISCPGDCQVGVVRECEVNELYQCCLKGDPNNCTGADIGCPAPKMPKFVGCEYQCDICMPLWDCEEAGEIICGNGICEGDENELICSEDCGSVIEEPNCGDGFCEPGEDKVSCSVDCEEVDDPVCGDEICEESEDETSCPGDCEIIDEPIEEPAECGNYLCEEGENEINCPNDCFIENGLDETAFFKESDFKSFLDVISHTSVIGSNGAVSYNQAGFKAVVFQRAGTKMIMRGIGNSDRSMIDKGVRAIEYAFRYQDPEGNFQNGVGLPDNNPDILESSTFFLASVGHAYYLIQESDYSDEFLPRLDALKPKISLALQWLTSYKETLRQKAANAPNRFVFDGLAFYLNGRILGNGEFKEIGEWFIEQNLATQRSDGIFVEHGGYDSSYQAVSLWKLQIYWLNSDEGALRNEVMAAIEKGMNWQKTRVFSNGQVDSTGNTRTGNCQEQIGGQCKEINYPEVIFNFFYYASIKGDSKSRELANRVFNYYKSY